jgi:outer membrane receptor protein involved in Fe transport
MPFTIIRAQSETSVPDETAVEDEMSLDESTGEELYVLPDFVVSTTADRGYYSANTTGVTRTNSLVKNSPITLSVVGKELLEDLQILNDQDLDLVSASIDADAAATPYSLNTISMRGFSSSFSRYDYFTRALPRNNYNNQRIEIIRGANSLIYGQADPGGALNYVPK